MKRNLSLVLLLAGGVLSSCAEVKKAPIAQNYSDVLHAEGFDPLAVVFLKGQPAAISDQLQSLDNETGVTEVLAENLEFIKSRPDITFQMVGWVDDVECIDENACVALSLRRASFVTQWYKKHGAANLAPPEGPGLYLALPLNPTEQERRLARRAELKIKWSGERLERQK